MHGVRVRRGRWFVLLQRRAPQQHNFRQRRIVLGRRIDGRHGATENAVEQFSGSEQIALLRPFYSPGHDRPSVRLQYGLQEQGARRRLAQGIRIGIAAIIASPSSQASSSSSTNNVPDNNVFRIGPHETSAHGPPIPPAVSSESPSLAPSFSHFPSRNLHSAQNLPHCRNTPRVPGKVQLAPRLSAFGAGRG